ncbi:hypothetical protein M3T53_06710 [Actinomyces sp. B33]|uniref:DUF6541 family protein n=1 Tax=Actinomyces sp. B33 TaxID=2942131 RepID=UPI0023426CFA|nr:DUF6541 family protein [Actinomyces sp. B33]MDC4233400.1 hypothetical protein [Actinomyces sp. B33]
MIGQWWTLIPTFVAMMVALVLPGCFWLRAGPRPVLVGLAAAPAFCAGLLTALSVLLPGLGGDWEPSAVLPVLGLSALIGAVILFLGHARRVNDGVMPRPGRYAAVLEPTLRPSSEARRSRAATAAAVLVGFAVAAAPMILTADPRDPVQQWDSTFHLNGVRAILQGGNASPFGGLSALYGGREVFYPTAWHAFVAIFVESRTIIQASNVSSLVLMAVWVVGATAFVSVVTDSRPAVLAAPVLAGALPSMPADALTMYNQWPHAMGLALVPGLAAAAVVVGRRVSEGVDEAGAVRAVLRQAPAGVFLAVGALGAVGAHPSAAFTLVVLLAPGLLSALVRLAGRAVAGRRVVEAVAWAAVGAMVVVVPLGLLTTEKIRAMGDYPRSGIGWGTALSHALMPVPPFSQTPGLRLLVLVQGVLLVVGVGAVLGAGRALVGWWRAGAPVAAVGEGPVVAGGGAEQGASDGVPERMTGVGRDAGAVSGGSPSEADRGRPLSAGSGVDPLGSGAPGGTGALGGDAVSDKALPGTNAEGEDPIAAGSGPSGPRAPGPASGAVVCAPVDAQNRVPLPERRGVEEAGPGVSAPDSSAGMRGDPFAVSFTGAAGIRVAARAGSPGVRWPLVSLVCFALLTLLAYAPNSPVRTFLLAPWYMDARRIMGAHGLAMVPIMAIGFSSLVSAIRGAAGPLHPGARRPVGGRPGAGRPGADLRLVVGLGALLLALSGFGAFDARVRAAAYVYDSDDLGKPGMATTGELAMLRRARLILPGDALVLGDPIAGAAYIETISDREAVFPQLTMANADEESQSLLADHFNEIHTNPRVCEVVRDLGITHFYAEEDGMYYNFSRSSRSPGLYGVDTSSGFEQVDAGGTAVLYKITACGEVAPGGAREAAVGGR